jgi:hypothetical protein
MAKKSTESAKSPADAAPTTNMAQANKAPATAPATPEAARAETQRQFDEIVELSTDVNNPAAVSLLCDKVAHQPDPEVRTRALEAIRSVNDTNAIPRLEEAVQILENPVEKAAVMEVIEYLKLPESMPDTPPTNMLSAADTSKLPPIKRTSGEQNRKKRADKIRASARMQRQGQSQQAPQQPAPSAPAQDATQPVGQSPDTAPPPQ